MRACVYIERCQSWRKDFKWRNCLMKALPESTSDWVKGRWRRKSSTTSCDTLRYVCSSLPLLTRHPVLGLEDNPKLWLYHVLFELKAIRDSFDSSSNSTWLLVGSWSFCIQHLPFSVSFRGMLGGSVEIWTTNIPIPVYWGSNSFWHAKRCWNKLALNGPKKVAFHSIQALPPSMHHNWK